jgi:hypothetical protein
VRSAAAPFGARISMRSVWPWRLKCVTVRMPSAVVTVKLRAASS